MPGYIVITGSPEAALQRRTQAETLEKSGWIAALRIAEAEVWVKGPAAPAVVELAGGGFVIGEAFQRGSGKPIASPGETAADRQDPGRVAEALWGGFVAVWPASDRATTVYRDPTGAFEVLSWSLQGQRIVSSSLSLNGLERLRPAARINWDRVATWIGDRAEIGGASALAGVDALHAGELRRLGVQGARISLWTPAGVVRGAQVPSSNPGEMLQATIDRCARSYAGASGRMIAELSGGLDSAVCGSALARSPGAQVAAWLNFHAREGGDERVFARLVAGRLQVDLLERRKAAPTIDPHGLEALSAEVRPSLNAVDEVYDAAVAELASTLGAEVVWTGQGGDEVFFAARSTAIASDLNPGRFWLAPWDARLHALARWTRTSVWALLRRRRRDQRRPPGAARLGLAPPTPRVRAAAETERHPWLSDTQGLPSAKVEQITYLTHTLLYRTTCRRAAVSRLVHAPLATPVVELALTIPTAILTGCRTDRGLVRQAFSDRLPPEVRDRTAKGDMTAHYGQAIGSALDRLRPYLLEGRLVEEGLLARDDLAGRLTPDALAWRGGFADLLDLMAVEAWTRRWS